MKILNRIHHFRILPSISFFFFLHQMDPCEQSESAKSQYGVLKLHPGSSLGSNSEYSTDQYSSFSFANPVYEPGGSGTGPSYKVEDIVLRMDGNRRSSGRWKGFKSKQSKIKYLNINDI